MALWNGIGRKTLLAAALTALAASAASGQVVISQVYGGGGNAGALYTNDFIELFNRGQNPVDISGWSVQYASAAGAFSGGANFKTDIPAGTVLQPGQYYLIQQSQGAGGSQALPTPDLIATSPIAMGGASGKVLLNSTTTAITGGGTNACAALFANPSLVDLVTYGGATCFEGSGAGPGTSNANSVIRGNHGCQDTNDNAADFTSVPAAPRNSATPLSVCTPSTPPSGMGASAPSPSCRNQNVVMTVAVTQGTSPASPIVSVIGDTTQIGGGPGVVFLDDGVAPDAAAGDGTYTAQAVVGAASPFAALSVPVTITDALGRMGQSGVVVNVVNCDPRGTLGLAPAGVCPGGSSLLTVPVLPGLNPASTGIQVIMDLSPIGLSGFQVLTDDGTQGDAVAGDGTYSYLANVPMATFPSAYALGGIILDDQGRVGSLAGTLTIVQCVESNSSIVISQVYGGGGNAGATYTNDFVELFNRTTAPISLDGLSLQYAASSGNFNSKVDLTGVIGARRYFLIRLSRGAGGTQELPEPDLDTPSNATIGVSSTAGRLALVSGTTLIGADCLSASNILDLVGYGSGTTCVEGAFPAPGTDNTTGVTRVNGGCQDFNQNVADFVRVAPNPRTGVTPPNNCGAAPTCPADYNGDGTVDPDDLADYIACYFSAPPCDRADFDGSGEADPDDLADFIAQYFGPPC